MHSNEREVKHQPRHTITRSELGEFEGKIFAQVNKYNKLDRNADGNRTSLMESDHKHMFIVISNNAF